MALFSEPIVENTYTLTTTAYLDIASRLLSPPYGNVAQVFKDTGYDLDWIHTTKHMMIYLDQQAIQLVQQNPALSEEQFYQILYQGLMTTDQLTDEQKQEFSDMTLEQVKPLLQHIIWSNPTKDESHTRTFQEFVGAVQLPEENKTIGI